ncbi:MAG TPA: cytochrome ubiquinol oxidase subunit I [Acidobacteriota bacterium]|nr:cytochrome ubiquinol oxidase subunit I [Acidobacteriota bacterium]
MSFPIFNVGPFGPSTLIAVMAIVHVTIAQFAVGAGIATVWLETRARRRGDSLLLGFLKRYLRFLILLAFVGGVVTGVGIWLVIGLISPEATSLLLRQFIWAWAAEWVLFLVEIISGYVYYFYWDRLDPKTHIRVGIVYAVSAWGSLVIINGILAFMLTPGDWLTTHSFWDGWLNPTFLPSLLLRTVVSLALAGLFVAVVVNLDKHYNRDERRHIINEGAVFLVPLVLAVPAGLWYFAAIPKAALMLVAGGAIAMTLFFGFGMIATGLIGVYAYFALIRNKRGVSLETALLLAGLAFIAYGSMEYVREGIRKPYVIYNYMYANGLTHDDMTALNASGFWALQPVAAHDVSPRTATEVERGEAIFKVQCGRCHAVDGYNAIRPLVASWTPEMIRDNTRRLERLKPYMPPFAGTERDLEDLVAYLSTFRSAEWTRLTEQTTNAGGGR